MFPDFIGIGAQKAGTTWLDRNLRAHPQVWMPRIKEIHYFDRKINDPRGAIRRLFGRRPPDQQWRKQVKYCVKAHLIRNFSFEDLLWDFRYYMRSPDDEWYASIFEPGKGRVTGEITPAYSTLAKDAVAHVHEIMPEAKIIFMMRNPVERAWSQAVMSFDKVEKGSAKSVSKKRFLRRFERNSLTLLTDYRQALENWSSFYPEEQIFVGFLEDVHFHPENLLRRLYDFLGADPSFEPSSAREKIHSRSENKMPVSLATHLARTYYDELEQLRGRFGGYASFWLYCADRLINEPSEQQRKFIRYPLWESSLRGEWMSASGVEPAMGSTEAEPQSGPLSLILHASEDR